MAHHTEEPGPVESEPSATGYPDWYDPQKHRPGPNIADINSLEHTALVLGVNPRTVRRLIDDGLLQVTSIRRRRVILGSTIRDYLAKHTYTHVPTPRETSKTEGKAPVRRYRRAR